MREGRNGSANFPEKENWKYDQHGMLRVHERDWGGFFSKPMHDAAKS